MKRKRGGQSASSQSVVTFLLRCRSGPCKHSKSDTEARVGLKVVPGVYIYCNEHRFVLHTHFWAQDTCKITPKRYKQLRQWKSDTKWQSVSILSILSLWHMVGEMYSPRLWGSASPATKAAHITEVIHPLCSERQHPGVFWVSSREKKLPVLIHAAIPPQTILRLFLFSPQFFFSLCTSHDCLPLLLHHGWGFLVLTGSRGSRTLLVWNLDFLCRWGYGVFRDGTILHVTGEVAVTVDGYRTESGGEMEGQWASGGDIGDAGVWHHRSVAVSVTAAPSFPFKVQGQGSPAPGLFDLGLHLGRKVWDFNFQKLPVISSIEAKIWK